MPLIDEYDRPLLRCSDNNVYQKTVRVLRDLLTTTIKGNQRIRKVVMTGVLDLSNVGILDDFHVYNVGNDTRYSPYFGFTESEVDGLLDDTLDGDLEDKKYWKQALTAWYGGYNIGS
jgi:hypothetical protein